MKTLNGLYYPTRELKNCKTNLFCFSAHITQNQYSPNTGLHTSSQLCNYRSQMQSLSNYLRPLLLHEFQDKNRHYLVIFPEVWLLDSRLLIEQTSPRAKQIISQRNSAALMKCGQKHKLKSNILNASKIITAMRYVRKKQKSAQCLFDLIESSLQILCVLYWL